MKPLGAAFIAVCAAAFSILTSFGQPTVLEIGPEATRSSRLRAEGYRVSAFEVKGRWMGALSIPLRVGDIWSAEKQSQVLNAVREAFAPDEFSAHLLGQEGEVQVFYVDVLEEKDEATHSVKLTFRPLNVRVSLAKLGNNVLPIPRSPFATRYQSVPAPLLALRPSFGMTYDRAFGTALAGGFDTDLLALPDTAKGRLPDQPTPHHLDARFEGAKSFEDFYRANAGLTYAQRRMGETLQEASVTADYTGAQEPLANATHSAAAAGARASITVRLAAHTRLTLDTGYRHAWDDVEEFGVSARTETDVQPNRVLAESLVPRPLGGFLRAAIWEDNGWTDSHIGIHQRVVGRIGYAREFAVAPNQTIGVELLSGGGRLWGDAPAHRQFFGGNSPGQFLYDGVGSPNLVAMPAGPLIRSFGETEATGNRGARPRGGDAFWHVNLNLTFPIRPLSRPLIPQEDDVRGMLKNGINISGRNMLISALKNQGLSREQAVIEADKTLNEIRPATEFIIDEANVYALKPLLMFDAGGLAGAGRDATWLAAGGGLQLTIVTAKIELGYMHTVSGPVSADRGNFFARLVFQNLF